MNFWSSTSGPNVDEPFNLRYTLGRRRLRAHVRLDSLVRRICAPVGSDLRNEQARIQDQFRQEVSQISALVLSFRVTFTLLTLPVVCGSDRIGHTFSSAGTLRARALSVYIVRADAIARFHLAE